MGPPISGRPLDKEELQNITPYVRMRATDQLLALWKTEKYKEQFEPLWGDEIEYLLVTLDEDFHRAAVSLDQTRILREWAARQKSNKLGIFQAMQEKILRAFGWDKSLGSHASLQPEWAGCMLETTPAKPFNGSFDSLMNVEGNMKRRRYLIKELLSKNQHVITLPVFPRLGVPGQFTAPYYEPQTGLRSSMLPRELASPIIRYRIMEDNIVSRRGTKIESHIPVFRDVKTPWPFQDMPLSRSRVMGDKMPSPLPNAIYMDGFGFGVSSCCLQVTFQAQNESEARWLYDQLIPFGPILLALTAATPIYKGYLANTDVRWDCISSTLDDRTPEERNERPMRYSPNSTYISRDARRLDEYLCPDLWIDTRVKNQLLEGGMDEPLATHFAHILAYDSLHLTTDLVENIDTNDTNVFENFHSGVYQHVRFKAPPPKSSIGWRVEFRPMEIQAKDSENAAFSIFMYLVSRAIVTFDLNFYIPIDKVRESIHAAKERDSVTEERFWFRNSDWCPEKFRYILISSDIMAGNGEHTDEKAMADTGSDSGYSESTLAYGLMTVDEIINGHSAASWSTNSSSSASSNDGTEFPGLISIIYAYLRYSGFSPSEQSDLSRYLDIVSKKASGELWTVAKWIRSFVREHPDYQQDSAVSEKVCCDLLKQVSLMGEQ